jgi:hypothetical protein
MEVIEQYITQVQEWRHSNWQNFMGANEETEVFYKLGLTPRCPQELDCFIFNVIPRKEIINSKNGEVFCGQTWTAFKLS